VSSLSVIAAALLFPASLVVVGFGSNDQYAVIGAAVAAVIAVVAVRRYDQTLPNALCVVLGSFICGVTVPGVFINTLTWKGVLDIGSHQFLSWHMWTLLGLVCGLTGWATCQAIYQVSTKVIPGIVSKLGDWLDRFLTPKQP
jgi:predicted membrane protein